MNTSAKSILFGILLLHTLLISSCCRKEFMETARYELSSAELNLIPYQLGQEINFVHSNGYAFNFVVTEDQKVWQVSSDFCEMKCCGNDYFSYQTRRTKLVASYPMLTINLSLGGERFYDYPASMYMNMDINNRHFASIPYDSAGNFVCDSLTQTMCFDSVLVNNKVFLNVYEKDFDDQYFIQDSTLLVPKSVLYNKQGILQIKMSNNETYSISN